MKRSVPAVLVLLTAAILLRGCGGGGYVQSGSTNVTVSVGSVASNAAVEPRAPTIPSEVASLRLTVSSTATPADMAPIVSTLAVTPGVTTYQLSVTVPNGTRNFLLEAFDDTSTLRYRGDATMILAGGTASVTIQMSADVTPPSVLSVSPVSGATGVAVSSPVTVTFSEAMDATTVTGATFAVTAGGTPVPGTVGYSGATATFTPTGNLNDSTTYTVTVTTGAEDLAGNAIASDYVWSFTTVAPLGTASAPAFSPAAGTYATAQSVTLSTATPGATIRYTTDGSTPTSTTGTLYAVPIAVSATTTIRAIAYLAGWADSAVASGAYTITGTGSGNVSGEVRDAVARTPLANASISVLKQGAVVASALTNAAGTFTVPVPAGSGYSIAFSKVGYIPTDYLNVSVTADITTYLETILQIDVAHSGPGIVSGAIVNALTGAGVQGLVMVLRAGINVNTAGAIVASMTTQESGIYSISNLPAGQYTAEVGGTGYNFAYFTIVSIGGTTTGNQNATITPILTTQETRIILTWGLTPEDLDSHMTGPLPDGTRFHMYFPYAGDLESPWPTYVKLDLDDTMSYGPETTTIYQQIPGTYRFSVHDYTNQSSTNSYALSGSGAQVRVYQGINLVASFNVPANQAATLWTVFEMDGTTITPINTMSNVSDSTLVLSPSRVGSAGKDATLFRNLPLKR